MIISILQYIKVHVYRKGYSTDLPGILIDLRLLATHNPHGPVGEAAAAAPGRMEKVLVLGQVVKVSKSNICFTKNMSLK